MNNTRNSQSSVVARFRVLHESGCFVLPNPWDVGTAMYLEHLGFDALATTSAGFAFSRGLPDSVSAVTRGAMLAHISEVVDANGDTTAPLYEFSLAVERIRAARAAIDASGVPVVLTARCEAWLVGQPDPARVALERLVAYADAGADCLYAPGARLTDEIESIVKAVSPKPVNVLVSRFNSDLTVSRLADLG